ncbi:aldo/keto reductase, partial [Stutzerimonas stutzeri]|uniref:aldo/keto reductase n=1 Tax=Stutzerimonas stutzeri TaxID=316 RepID=UPI001BD21DB6|nr:aldo/keto reductase [Stutzerimonas stutzeri]
QSLKNLGMDYIDLYIYHIWDYNTPIIDVLEAVTYRCYCWQSTICWYFKLLCLAAGEGERPC